MTNPTAPDLGLEQRKVLVTGGSRGIGRACVTLFATCGARVAFTYRQDEKDATDLVSWATRRSMIVRALRTDAADAASYGRLSGDVTAALGSLDILVNNIGDAVRRSSFAQSDDKLWTDSLTINLLSAVRATRALRPLLVASDAGVIVNISSIAATTTGAGDSLHYGVAKAALNTFTIGLAKEFAGTKVRSVGVSPSAIDTDFQTRHSSAERLKKIVEQTPSGRVGTAAEVAWAVALLASPQSAYINGAIVPVTGGR
jgi:3-oxoacyl-[acyl-carrier protein] reductase